MILLSSMKTIGSALTKNEIRHLQEAHGDYVKITADIKNKKLVVGVELHADAEELLLNEGGRIDDLWGGGINFKTKQIDATAVYNIRPSLKNESLEILDSKTREKFIDLVKLFFRPLYE